MALNFSFAPLLMPFLKRIVGYFWMNSTAILRAREGMCFVCFVLQCNILVRSTIFVFDLFMNLMLYFLSNAHRVYSYPCIRAFLDTTEVRLQTKKFQKLPIVQNFQIKFSLNVFFCVVFFFGHSYLNLRMNICRHFG